MRGIGDGSAGVDEGDEALTRHCGRPDTHVEACIYILTRRAERVSRDSHLASPSTIDTQVLQML